LKSHVEGIDVVKINRDLPIFNISCLSGIALLCPGLIKLSLSNCHDLTSTTMSTVFDCCPLLQHLDIENNNSTPLSLLDGDKMLTSLSTKCPLLDSLHLKLVAMTDDGLIPFVQNRPHLKVLRLSNCSPTGLTDVAISHIASSCPELTRFTLTKCFSVTDISGIIKSCESLRFLSVSGCENIDSDLLLEQVRLFGQSLRELNIMNLGVTAEDAFEFAMCCRWVESLRYKDGYDYFEM
jgi:hypothetical protein